MCKTLMRDGFDMQLPAISAPQPPDDLWPQQDMVLAAAASREGLVPILSDDPSQSEWRLVQSFHSISGLCCNSRLLPTSVGGFVEMMSAGSLMPSVKPIERSFPNRQPWREG